MVGKKLASLRKEKERLSAEKMFLYDKCRSDEMTREQFKAKAKGIAVRIKELGREREDAEVKIESLKGYSSQESEIVLEGIAALQELDKAVLRKAIDRIMV